MLSKCVLKHYAPTSPSEASHIFETKEEELAILKGGFKPLAVADYLPNFLFLMIKLIL